MDNSFIAGVLSFCKKAGYDESDVKHMLAFVKMSEGFGFRERETGNLDPLSDLSRGQIGQPAEYRYNVPAGWDYDRPRATFQQPQYQEQAVPQQQQVPGSVPAYDPQGGLGGAAKDVLEPAAGYAAAGSMFGPVGALGGGLYGLYKGWSEGRADAEKAQAQARAEGRRADAANARDRRNMVKITYNAGGKPVTEYLPKGLDAKSFDPRNKERMDAYLKAHSAQPSTPAATSGRPAEAPTYDARFEDIWSRSVQGNPMYQGWTADLQHADPRVRAQAQQNLESAKANAWYAAQSQNPTYLSAQSPEEASLHVGTVHGWNSPLSRQVSEYWRVRPYQAPQTAGADISKVVGQPSAPKTQVQAETPKQEIMNPAPKAVNPLKENPLPE